MVLVVCENMTVYGLVLLCVGDSCSVVCWSSGAGTTWPASQCQYCLGYHPVNIFHPPHLVNQHNLQFRETWLCCHAAAYLCVHSLTGCMGFGPTVSWDTLRSSLTSESIATFTVNWYEVKCVKLLSFSSCSDHWSEYEYEADVCGDICIYNETNVNWDVKYVHLKLQGVSPAQQDWG